MSASVSGPNSPTAILIHRNDFPQIAPSSQNAPHSFNRIAVPFLQRAGVSHTVCLSSGPQRSARCHTRRAEQKNGTVLFRTTRTVPKLPGEFFPTFGLV